jgi:hypothetical protein
MMMKTHPQKNTLLKNAQGNRTGNFFKRVFFSPPQKEIQFFFPTLQKKLNHPNAPCKHLTLQL